MKNTWSILIILAVIVSILVIFGVSWHSVEEIHYLKSFYPQTFTVEEAYYAGWVEFIKVHIINIPFVVVIFVGLYLLRQLRGRGGRE
jgi:Na+-driven multidrug efflux pump